MDHQITYIRGLEGRGNRQVFGAHADDACKPAC